MRGGAACGRPSFFTEDKEKDMTTERQMSESFRLGALLALAGGFLDSYTYLVRGGVFANAQTGNIVLLGVNLFQGEIPAALHYLLPILAFAAGVLVSELVRRRLEESAVVHWRQVIVVIEMAALGVVAFLPRTLNMPANAAVSFVCAMQVEAFRKLHGSAFATTMCTGNLRSGTEQLYRYAVTGDRACRTRGMQYLGIILFFIAGAGLGAWGTGPLKERAVLLACVPLLAGFVLMFFKRAGAGEGDRQGGGRRGLRHRKGT